MRKAINKNTDFSYPNGPLFVIGMPRSGTTVISEAISAHEDLGWLSNYINWFPGLPQLAVLSRLLNIPYIGPYCRGKKAQDNRISSYLRRMLPYSAEAYPVWNRYCAKNFATDFLRNRCATSKEKEQALALVSQVLRYQGKKRFFSKQTGPPRIRYLDSIFPDAFFLNVIRDPRANISSLLKVSFWIENDGYSKPWWTNGLSPAAIDEWESYDRSPIALAAIQWREVVATTWYEKELIERNRYVEVRYEDFVKNPIITIQLICEKVGLRPSQMISRYIHSIGKVYDMNYKFSKFFSKKEIEIIDEITATVKMAAGYNI